MSDISSTDVLGAKKDSSLFNDTDVENALNSLAYAMRIGEINGSLEDQIVIIPPFTFKFQPAFGVCLIELEVEGENNPRKLQINSKDELLQILDKLPAGLDGYFIIDDYDHDFEDYGMHSDV